MFNFRGFGKGKEATNAEAAQLASREEADKALANSKFVEYLDNQDLDLRDKEPAEIVQHYETYKKAMEVVMAWQGIFSDEVKSDTRGEIRLGDEAKNKIESYILSEAARNPDGIVEIMKVIQEFKDLKKQIIAEESKIKSAQKDLQNSQAAAERRETNFQKRQKELNEFNRKHILKSGLNKAWSLARSLDHDSIVELKKTRKEQAKIQKRIEDTGQLAELQGKLAQWKANAFQRSELGQMVNEEVARQIHEHFFQKADVARNLRSEEVNRTLEALENLEHLDSDPDTGAMDYLRTMKSARGEYSRDEIHNRLRAELGQRIRDLIEAEFCASTPTMEKIMGKLAQFIKVNKAGNALDNKHLLQLMFDLEAEGRVEGWPAGKRTVFSYMLRRLQAAN